jgi:hypothetical protein
MLIELPGRWLDVSQFEELLSSGPSPHENSAGDVLFRFQTRCQLMTDAIVRLLSLINQLHLCTHRVVLDFMAEDSPLAGYLNRIGFFDHLPLDVEVRPSRPDFSTARIYAGANRGLVEIAHIDPGAERDSGLLDRLTGAIQAACGNRRDAAQLEGAAWTIFAELIDNIYSHSGTPVKGFAALQVYKKGNILKVAVSDSGKGLLETLRPSLKSQQPRLADLPDMELLVEVFRRGLSRHGPDRGCGLKGSAEKAIKFRAELDVRLPRVRVHFLPGTDGYARNTAYCYKNLPLIWGTHLSFAFKLD